MRSISKDPAAILEETPKETPKNSWKTESWKTLRHRQSNTGTTLLREKISPTPLSNIPGETPAPVRTLTKISWGTTKETPQEISHNGLWQHYRKTSARNLRRNSCRNCGRKPTKIFWEKEFGEILRRTTEGIMENRSRQKFWLNSSSKSRRKTTKNSWKKIDQNSRKKLQEKSVGI